MTMHDLALPVVLAIGAAWQRNCRNLGREIPHSPAVVASHLRRGQRWVRRAMRPAGLKQGIWYLQIRRDEKGLCGSLASYLSTSLCKVQAAFGPWLKL